jgi:hypothetical protein
MYGYCPLCGAAGKDRERRIGGNDTCAAGHVYPSRMSLASKPPATNELLREASQLLAVVEGKFNEREVAPEFLRRVRETRILIDAHLVNAARGLTQ